MKTITYISLKRELKNHRYGLYGSHTLTKLFKIYTSYEIKNYDDFFLKDHHRDFVNFVVENINMFNGFGTGENEILTEEDKQSISRFASSTCAQLNLVISKFFAPYRHSQENFVKKVEDILGTSRPKILEIGSGKVPYSSLLLAKDLGHIDSMDRFILSDESLKNMNVEPHDQYFEMETNIKDFDMVIGNKPCSAISAIVTNCSATKKPYFIELCGCDAPHQDIDNWYELLKEQDKNIQFDQKNHYAYNLEL